MPSRPARPASSEPELFRQLLARRRATRHHGLQKINEVTITREAGMRALIRRLWTEHRARKYARRRCREEFTDRREAEHLERQRAGIRDVHGPGGF
jgi:hypothetical protein